MRFLLSVGEKVWQFKQKKNRHEKSHSGSGVSTSFYRVCFAYLSYADVPADASPTRETSPLSRNAVAANATGDEAELINTLVY